MQGEKPYEYKDPIQQPIAPPYASFLKHKSPVQIPDEQQIAEAFKKVQNIPSTFHTNPDDLDKIIEELKTLGDFPDTSEDYINSSDISLLKAPSNSQDYVDKVTKERAKLSDEKFSPTPELLCDLKPAEVNTKEIEIEQQDYKNLAEILLLQHSTENEHISEEQSNADEPEFLKVVKDALFGGKPLAKDEFLKQLNKVFNTESKKEFSLKCICNEDSDLDDDI